MEKKNRTFYLVFISVFLLLGNLIAEAQTGRTISGIVVSEVDNEPLIGVNVVQKGTTNGVVTDREIYFNCSGWECFTNFVYWISGTTSDS